MRLSIFMKNSYFLNNNTIARNLFDVVNSNILEFPADDF